jgi:predicted enzyme related to lactoylglutathione lyase
MLTKTRIGAVVYIVRDLNKTRHFYGEVLDLPIETVKGHDGDFLAAQAGEISLVFFQGNDKPGRTPIVVFTLEEEDIHALVDRLAERGVEIIAPVQDAPDGGLTADFLDPDGHVLSVYKTRA